MQSILSGLLAAPLRPAAFAVAAMLAPAHGAHAADDPVVLIDVPIIMSDGVRLVADIYLPPGTPADGSVQVPCLVEMTPYRKESRAAEGASLLPAEGFALIEVDIRGTGGSEGEYDIVFSLREQWDGAEIIDWAAEESGLCTERVGMYGGSYSGIIQYLVASLPPERAARHLAAIAPQRAYGDLYRDIVYQGGVMIGSFGAAWSSAATALYTQPPTNVNDPAGLNAYVDHMSANDPMWPKFVENPFIDAVYSSDDSAVGWTQLMYLDSSALPRIEHLTVPTLHLAGFFDAFTRGQLLTFEQALAAERAAKPGTRGPNYLIAGPWTHSGTHFIEPAHFPERLVSWYRHWLQDGPRPAWFDEPRVRYWVMGEGLIDDTDGAWKLADSWPPPADYTRFYLRADGSLAPGATPAEASLTWLYDPSTGGGEFPSRWDNAVPAVPATSNDQRIDGDRGGPTFLTAPMTEPMTFAGPLSLRLWMRTVGAGLGGVQDGLPDALSSLVPPYLDTDIVVKISDVQPDGTALLLTEGILRASHRALDDERSVRVGEEVIVPFHPHLASALEPVVADQLTEYWIEIWPTSKSLQPGHRLRLDLYSSDWPNHLTLQKPVVNTVQLGGETPSYLLLPLEPTATTSTRTPLDDRQQLRSQGGALAPTLLGLLLLGATRRRRRQRRQTPGAARGQ